METLERAFEVDGVRLKYGDTENGQPLLLRSGGHGLRDYLGGIADGLAHSIRVIRMDPRGCGDSTPDGCYDDGVTVQDMDRLRRHLGLDRWVVGGHSHGAHQALRYALAFPEAVRGVIYIAGIGLQRDRSWSQAYHRGRELGGDQEVPPERFQANPEAHRLSSASYAEFVRRPSLWKDVAALRVPFLAISGERDIRPDWPVRQLVELIPGASLVTIPGPPHALWYTHRDALRERIESFMAELG